MGQDGCALDRVLELPHIARPGARAERGEHLVGDADWSPDGGRVVYEEDNRIYVARADGGARRALGPGRSPRWR
jgi:hypothetical protein